MSFKREGDDSGWLDITRKRRIHELLAEDIPEEEAFLMRNGKFACLVCSHRPVFDTVNMLSVHRGGKKHQQNAETFNAKQLEIEVLKMKRAHEEYAKTGVVKSIPETSQSLGILKSVKYDPRVKKLRPNERRPVIDLDVKLPATEVTEATPLSSLPGGHSFPQTVAEYRKLQHTKERTAREQIQPYTRKSYMESGTSYTSKTNSTIASPQIVEQTGYANNRPGGNKSIQTATSLRVNNQVPKSHGTKSKGTKTNLEITYGPVNEAAIKKAEQYMMARGAGWKKDLSGNWVKDEDAEFDSDEEPPDLP